MLCSKVTVKTELASAELLGVLGEIQGCVPGNPGHSIFTNQSIDKLISSVFLFKDNLSSICS